MLELMARLKVAVRYCMAMGPRCLRWWTDTRSGPQAFVAFAFCMAVHVWLG